MNNLELKRAILQKIEEFQTIIIARHVKPDGDCIGSSLGLREILRLSFPEKRILSVGRPASSFFDFIGSEDPDVGEEIYREALVIVLDTANRDRIDNENYIRAPFVIKIDHHIPVEDYGHINYVREDLPATALIIADFYETFKNKLKMNSFAARALFIGTVTDTGRFKYSGVNAETLKLAAMLLSYDFDITKIYSYLYIRDINEFKMHGYILNKFKTTPRGVAYFVITQRLLKKFNISAEAASSLINVLDSIRGHLIWIFFVENKKGVYRVRLRSRLIPINELAARYEGGGHAQASGATVRGKGQIKKLVIEADLLVGEYKDRNPGAF